MCYTYADASGMDDIPVGDATAITAELSKRSGEVANLPLGGGEGCGLPNRSHDPTMLSTVFKTTESVPTIYQNSIF